jgi:hypothetical protein
MEATSKALEELQEQLAATKQAAADEASKATEAHALELQKMQVERTKLEVRRQYAACLVADVFFAASSCMQGRVACSTASSS